MNLTINLIPSIILSYNKINWASNFKNTSRKHRFIKYAVNTVWFQFFCTSDPMNKLITSYYDITKQQLRNIKNTRIKDTSYLYSEVQNFIKKLTIFQSSWETKNQGSTTLPKASQEATKTGSSRNYHAPCFNYLTHWFFYFFSIFFDF